MQTFDIKQESYFPPNFKIFGGLLIFGSLLLLGSVDTITWLRSILSITIFLLGIAMIFTRYGLMVDVINKTYTIYTLLYGFKIGEPVAFVFIDKFYINQMTEQALATTRTGAKFDVRKKVFKAYMRLDNGEKIHLDTDKDKNQLEKRINAYKIKVEPVYKPEDS